MSTTQTCFAPFQATSGEAVHLAMQRLLLTGQVLPAGARLIVQHVFRSQEKTPLEVIYAFPLPRDAALRRFRITGDGFEAHSELKETEAAVKTYEEGLAQGSLATLARQYGDGMINLTVGNIRPGETVTVWLEILAGVELKDAGFRFRFPFTLAPNYHAAAKAVLVGPGEGEMELPAAEFGDVILPRFREDASALHQIGFDLAISSQLELEEIGSPSHPVKVNKAHVALATGKDVPNRDLVLDVGFKASAQQVLAGRDKDGVGHFAVIVPSASFGNNEDTPRRVVIVLDRSGSMQGEPITQARKAIEACLGALSESDSFGLVAFDNTTEVFSPTLQPATREVREQARTFLNGIDARGGTELASGFEAAAKLLEGGGDILILTDGQVSGTETILERARAANVRLHTLGIGSASQDRFLTLLARETGGVSRFVTPRERVDLSAVDLFASIGRPLAAGLQAGANVQPQPPTAVFSGTPVLLFGEGDQGLDLTWDGGRLNVPVVYGESEIGETLWLLQGSRLITDWEGRYPGREALAPIEKRKENRIAMRLLELSRRYGLASREMSLVAVVKRAGDRPGELPETRVAPVGMAQDTAFGAYFGATGSTIGKARIARTMKLGSVRPTAASADRILMASMPAPPPMAPPMPVAASPAPPSQSAPTPASFFTRMFSSHKGTPQTPQQAPPIEKAKGPEDVLLDLAARMESDGGMPGKDAESRAEATILALLAFLTQGHTPSAGAFRSHVSKMVKFLKSVSGLGARQQRAVAAAIEQAEKGRAPKGDWLKLAQEPGHHWDRIFKSLDALS